jgi:hypothetical protein
MQLKQISREALLKPLQAVSGIVERRQTLRETYRLPAMRTQRSYKGHGARRLAAVVLSGLSLFPHSGHCGAPFATDDPATVAAGHVELLLFYQSTLSAAGRTGSLPGFEAHFGALDGFELDIVAPLAFSAPSGGGTQHGYGDTTLGAKYQLIRETDLLPLVSLVPKVTVPTGNSDRGLGNGGSQVLLATAAQKTYGSFLTYGNVGYWINNGPGNRNYWFLGWEAQYQLSAAWIIGAEIFHTTGQTSIQSPSTGFNIGAYYVFDPDAMLLFSAGRGLQNAAQTNRVSSYVGLQVSF